MPCCPSLWLHLQVALPGGSGQGSTERTGPVTHPHWPLLELGAMMLIGTFSWPWGQGQFPGTM